jgi:hypothetical protein
MTLALLSAILFSNPAGIASEPPPYSVLKAGQPAEIKGEWRTHGVFAASEIELLDEARRPKFRGTIDAVDTVAHAIRMFGQWIAIISDTQFLDAPDGPVDFGLLKPNARVEISCKVDSSGRWSARHIRQQKVKTSDKIKGTITRTAFDGQSPDTLFIEALPILVTDKTEVFRTLGGASDAAPDTGAVAKPGGGE